MPRSIRVLMIEDVAPVREGLAALVAAAPGLRVSGSFDSMEAALASEAPAGSDVALVDIGLPGMSGLEGVGRLKDRRPELQILMLTVFSDNERIFEAICAGACGYLLKDTPPARLLEAVREVHAGGAPMSPDVARKVVAMFQRAAPPRDPGRRLSPRELQVLKLLADGHSYKTAAAELVLSQDTVRFHIRGIYEKLHVHSKSEAVAKAIRSGLFR